MKLRSNRVGIDCFNDCKRVIEVFALKSLLQSIAASRVQSVEALKLKSTIQTLYKFSHEKTAFVEQLMACQWRLNIIIFSVGYYFEFLTSFCMRMYEKCDFFILSSDCIEFSSTFRYSMWLCHPGFFAYG